MEKPIERDGGQNRLLAAMSAAIRDLMVSDLRQMSLAQGLTLYERGAAIDHVYFPETGLVCLFVGGRDGGTLTAMVGREGAIGLHAGLGPRQSFARATVQIGGRFSSISAEHFARIVQAETRLRDLVTTYIELQWARAQQTAACNALHDALSRLCRWLLQTADRAGSEQIAFTQEFLAQMLGVRRTTVTLLAQSLQKDRLIKYSRGRITLLDRDGLERNACECYGVLHDDALPQTIGIRF